MNPSKWCANKKDRISVCRFSSPAVCQRQRWVAKGPMATATCMSSSFSKASKSNSRLRRPKAVKQVSQLPQIEHAATQRSRQQNQTGGERTLLSGVASPRISSVVVSSKCAWHTVKHTVPSGSRKETKQAFEAPSFLPPLLACFLPSCLPSFFPFIFVDAFIFMFDAFTFSF